MKGYLKTRFAIIKIIFKLNFLKKLFKGMATKHLHITEIIIMYRLIMIIIQTIHIIIVTIIVK